MKRCVRLVSTLVLCFLLCLSGMVASIPATMAAETGSWKQLPLYGGDVSALAVNPITPSTVYLGATSGGVFRSTDSGASVDGGEFGPHESGCPLSCHQPNHTFHPVRSHPERRRLPLHGQRRQRGRQ